MRNLPANTILRYAFLATLFLVFIIAAVVARGHPPAIGRFPFYVSLVGIALLLIDVLVLTRTGASSEGDTGDLEVAEGQDDLRSLLRAGRYMAWMGGLFVVMAIIPYVAAAGLFVVAFYRIEARTSWRTALIAAVAAIALLWVLTVVLNMRWPDPLLFAGD